MDDLISRQAAIEEISKQQTYKMFEGEDTLYLDANDVGSVLASLPSAQPVAKDINVPVKDCISRQAAIDAFYKHPNIDWTTLDVLAKINALPSAQPDVLACGEGELIAQPEDHKCDCGHDIIWQLPRDDKWYCADAERKDG